MHFLYCCSLSLPVSVSASTGYGLQTKCTLDNRQFIQTRHFWLKKSNLPQRQRELWLVVFVVYRLINPFHSLKHSALWFSSSYLFLTVFWCHNSFSHVFRKVTGSAETWCTPVFLLTVCWMSVMLCFPVWSSDAAVVSLLLWINDNTMRKKLACVSLPSQ